MNHDFSFKGRLLDPQLTCLFFLENPPPTVSFYAYLPALYLQLLFSSHHIQLTYQIYKKNGIQIPFFFIQFYNSQETILLDTFINPFDYYEHQLMGLDALRALKEQSTIHIYFLNFDRQLYPDLEIPNDLNPTITQLIADLMIAEPWTPGMFQQTIQELNDTHPTPQDRQTFLSANSF